MLRQVNQHGTIMKNYSKRPRPVTVYIGNLIYSKSEPQIKRIFAKYGKVNFVRIVLNEKINRSKGIAFVQMSNPEAAKAAIADLDGRQLDGRKLKVSIAQEREEKKQPVGKVSKAKTDFEKEEKKEKSQKRQKKPQGLDVLFNYLQGR